MHKAAAASSSDHSMVASSSEVPDASASPLTGASKSWLRARPVRDSSPPASLAVSPSGRALFVRARWSLSVVTRRMRGSCEHAIVPVAPCDADDRTLGSRYDALACIPAPYSAAPDTREEAQERTRVGFSARLSCARVAPRARKNAVVHQSIRTGGGAVRRSSRARRRAIGCRSARSSCLS